MAIASVNQQPLVTTQPVTKNLTSYNSNGAIAKLGVGGACVDLRFWREGDRTRWDASVESGKLNIQEQPWQPWNVGKYT